MSEIWNPVSKSGEEPFVNKFHTWGDVIKHYRHEKNRLSIARSLMVAGKDHYRVLGVKEGDYYMEIFKDSWYIAYQFAETGEKRVSGGTTRNYDMYVATWVPLTSKPILRGLSWTQRRNGEYWAKGEFWMMSEDIKFRFINWTEDPFEEVK